MDGVRADIWQRLAAVPISSVEQRVTHVEQVRVTRIHIIPGSNFGGGSIEKQYNFLYEILTGEPVYFGERPRNAHHYMVISHDLFDYREQILAEVARRHGVSERGVVALRTVNEAFRKQIVKDKPFPKKIGGMAFPLEGYETLMLSVGSICDDCLCELAEGQRATYHVRTGKTYCDACASKYTVAAPASFPCEAGEDDETERAES